MPEIGDGIVVRRTTIGLEFQRMKCIEKDSLVQSERRMKRRIPACLVR